MTTTSTANQASSSNCLRLLVIASLPLLFVATAGGITGGWLNQESPPSDAEPSAEEAVSESRTFTGDSAKELPVFLFAVDVDTQITEMLTVANEDIACFDGERTWILLDGSDVGLAGQKISSFSAALPGRILLTFSEALSLGSISRPVLPTDIVCFYPETLGRETSGTFELHFVGANAGLNSSGEKIDALHQLDDGRIIISTVSSWRVPQLSGHDEDLLAFTPRAFGQETSGTWELYLDGSDIDLDGQDVDAVTVNPDGHIYLSGHDDFNAVVGSVDSNDVLTFLPTALGDESTGTYSPHLALHGASLNLGDANIQGLSIASGDARKAVLLTCPQSEHQAVSSIH